MTKLRELRLKAGLQRRFVASKLKINPDYLNHIERGEGKIDICRAQKMANLYKCSVKEILESWRELNEKENS